MKTSDIGRIKFYRGSGMEKNDEKCPSAKKLRGNTVVFTAHYIHLKKSCDFYLFKSICTIC